MIHLSLLLASHSNSLQAPIKRTIYTFEKRGQTNGLPIDYMISFILIKKKIINIVMTLLKSYVLMVVFNCREKHSYGGSKLSLTRAP